MKTKKLKGLHPHRFKDNPEEKRFAEAWSQDSNGRLKYLLCEGDQRFPPAPTEREEVVAATVVQWLGSPVGQTFLRDLGYKRKEQ